ncbi:MAG: phosphoglucosamine mutase [Candidatus Kapaibacteriales bacterium]
MPLIRSISGLRGTSDDLHPDIIRSYVLGFENLLSDGTIVIGADGRYGFESTYEVVVDSLLQAGRKIINCGVVPTPTVQIIVQEQRSAGGIVITASHNPSGWNGLKFINSDGIFLRPNEVKKLWKIVDKGPIISKIGKGEIFELTNINEIHFNKILNLSFFKANEVIDSIKSRNFCVGIDSVNSSGSKIIPEFLERLGCSTFKVNCNGDGFFSHNPEPKPEHLGEIMKMVKINKANLGFAVDPDADRLMIIDELGNALSEELTIVLAFLSVAKFYQESKSNYSKNVVVNYSTSSLIDLFALKFGFRVLRSPVGEINVVEKMLSTNAVIGGEGSGGVILPECHYGRDSLVGIALTLALLANIDDTLSQLVSQFPKLYQKKYKIRPNEGFEEALMDIPTILDNVTDIKNDDGLWVQTSNGWLHIRRSNTEPIARVIFESKYEEFILQIEDLIKKHFEVISNE